MLGSEPRAEFWAITDCVWGGWVEVRAEDVGCVCVCVCVCVFACACPPTAS